MRVMGLAKVYAEYLQDVRGVIARIMSEKIANQVHMQGAKNKVFILCTDNNAIYTRLRFIIPQLEKELRKNSKYASLKSIKIVKSLKMHELENAPKYTAPLKPKPIPPTSATKADALNTAASVKNEAIRARLERLLNSL